MIEWSAPSSCPSSASVDARAEALLLAADGQVSARATVTAAQSGYALSLEVGGRQLEYAAQTCTALANLAALVVAVSADPVAVGKSIGPRVHLPPPPSRSEPGPAIAVPAIAAAPVRGVPAPSPPQRGGWLRIHALIGIAELPGLDAGGGLAAGLELGRLLVELRGDFIAPRRAIVPELAPATIRMQSINTSARIGALIGRGPVRFAASAGAEIGVVTSRGERVAQSEDATDVWLGLLVAPTLIARVHPRVDLHAGADLIFAARRPVFALRDDPAATVGTGQGGLRAFAGVAVRFGKTARVRRSGGLATDRGDR